MVSPYFKDSVWYKDIIFYLQNLQCPLDGKAQYRSLKLKSLKYCILQEKLYWEYPGGILLDFINEIQMPEIINEFNRGICGGHQAWKATAYKILRVGYYWPSLYQDTCTMVRTCLECQKNFEKQKLKSLPLKPVKLDAPFQQWGLDFIGEIVPNSSGQHKYIMTATDYFTKWVEAIPTRKADENAIIKSIEQNILSRFRCPKKIITDNGATFKSNKMIQFC